MNRSHSMAITSPSAVIPPNVRMGVNADARSTLNPITITMHVAIIEGPVWRSAEASAPSPRRDRSRYS